MPENKIKTKHKNIKAKNFNNVQFENLLYRFCCIHKQQKAACQQNQKVLMMVTGVFLTGVFLLVQQDCGTSCHSISCHLRTMSPSRGS
jgi:hypothetical protein